MRSESVTEAERSEYAVLAARDRAAEQSGPCPVTGEDRPIDPHARPLSEQERERFADLGFRIAVAESAPATSAQRRENLARRPEHSPAVIRRGRTRQARCGAKRTRGSRRGTASRAGPDDSDGESDPSDPPLGSGWQGRHRGTDHWKRSGPFSGPRSASPRRRVGTYLAAAPHALVGARRACQNATPSPRGGV